MLELRKDALLHFNSHFQEVKTMKRIFKMTLNDLFRATPYKIMLELHRDELPLFE
jgi:hypothetical protein